MTETWEYEREFFSAQRKLRELTNDEKGTVKEYHLCFLAFLFMPPSSLIEIIKELQPSAWRDLACDLLRTYPDYREVSP
jgi:hypothetical protein